MADKFVPITVNSEIVCYAVGDKNAKLLSQIIHQMRGFFAENYEDPTVGVLKGGKKEDIVK